MLSTLHALSASSMERQIRANNILACRSKCRVGGDRAKCLLGIEPRLTYLHLVVFRERMKSHKSQLCTMLAADLQDLSVPHPCTYHTISVSHMEKVWSQHGLA